MISAATLSVYIAGTPFAANSLNKKNANINFLLIRKIYSTQSFVNLQYQMK